MELKTTYYKNILDQFDVHVRTTRSVNNGNHYKGQVKEYFIFLEEIGVLNLKKVDNEIAKAYFNHLASRPKKRGDGTLTASSINDNLSTLRMLAKRLCQDSGVLDKGMPVANNLKIERNSENDFAIVRQILTTDEVKEVYEHCETQTEKALIALCYGCGLRRTSLAEMRSDKIDFQKGTVTSFKGKNNNTYTVPVSDFFMKVLKKYSTHRLNILAKLRLRDERYFIDEKGSKISGDGLNTMLKHIIQRTSNLEIIQKNITLHCLRHSIATHLLDAGETFEFVKTFLGHSISDTSLIYARRRKHQNYYAI